MPSLVVLFTKLPNACTETSFFPGVSDCENAGSAMEAMLTNDAMTNFLLNISFSFCFTGHRLSLVHVPQCSPALRHAAFQSGRINEPLEMQCLRSNVMLERRPSVRHLPECRQTWRLRRTCH